MNNIFTICLLVESASGSCHVSIFQLCSLPPGRLDASPWATYWTVETHPRSEPRSRVARWNAKTNDCRIVSLKLNVVVLQPYLRYLCVSRNGVTTHVYLRIVLKPQRNCWHVLYEILIDFLACFTVSLNVNGAFLVVRKLYISFTQVRKSKQLKV